MKKITATIIVAITLIFFATPVLAVEKSTKQKCEENKTDTQVCLNVPIGVFDRVDLDSHAFANYIKAWYGFAIGSVGIFATVMIMWGGFKWLTSRGNSGVIGEAKEYIWGAIIGLMLAFLSYTILNIINPDLVVIKGINLPEVDWHTNKNALKEMTAGECYTYCHDNNCSHYWKIGEGCTCYDCKK